MTDKWLGTHMGVLEHVSMLRVQLGSPLKLHSLLAHILFDRHADWASLILTFLVMFQKLSGCYTSAGGTVKTSVMAISNTKLHI